MPMSYTNDHKCLITKQRFSIFMDSGNFDEEGLLKNIQLSELALKMSKHTFGWNNHSDPVKKAHELMSEVRKLSLEISEYDQRMGSALGEYQRNIIYNSMEDLENLISHMKNKITPTVSLEIDT
jgi:hypothetical protein